MVKNPPAMQRHRRCGFDPCVGKILWRRKRQSTPAFLPEKSRGQGAWWATVHGVTKSQTRLSEQVNHIQGEALPVSVRAVWCDRFSPIYCCAVFHSSLHLSKGLAVIRPSISILDSCICRCSGALIPVKGTATSSIQGHAPSSVTLRQIKSGDQTYVTFTG